MRRGALNARHRSVLLTSSHRMLPSLQQSELHNGDRMSLEEFLQRWEGIPELKHAELINGVVYLASPVSVRHGVYESLMIGWLQYYATTFDPELEICSKYDSASRWVSVSA